MLFIFDNQCSQRLANGLNILEEGNKLSPHQCTVKHIKDLIPGNSTDEKVIETAGINKGIIITYDKDFRELKQHYPLYERHKVGVAFFRSPKKVLRYWDIVVSFINHWEKLKENIYNDKAPFAYEVTLRGISKLI